MRQYLLPEYYQTFGSYFCVCLLCHAMLVDVDWVSDIHDRCELIILMVYLRWQLKHTSGWIEAPGYSKTCLSRHLGIPGLACFSFGPPPRLKGIMRLFILETSVCSHKPLWALAQLIKSCELLQWQTSRCRGCRCTGLPDRKVLAPLKDCVSVIRFSNTMQCEKFNGGDRVLWGKVRKPLQSV